VAAISPQNVVEPRQARELTRQERQAAHRGVPINVLSAIMGHSNIGVTQRVYVHLYGREEAEDAFRKAMGS
jgi:integrase